MKKLFYVAQFICALIILAAFASVTALNAAKIARQPDAGILIAFFGALIMLSAAMTRLAWKELKGLKKQLKK
jgi:hypothetical protein